ncbi:MAG: hypothetical protein HYS18_17720 [Burkholderiales bacterium]|nr:hypothetical protein [Burkholderiales bacterium]
MRSLRLFIVVLISLALPFTNVAAAAMAHCGQMNSSMHHKSAAPMEHAATDVSHIDHSKMDHSAHQMMDNQASADENPSSNNDVTACNHCSYCQSCVSVMIPLSINPVPTLNSSGAEKSFITTSVPQSVVESLFRPPRLAFA